MHCKNEKFCLTRVDNDSVMNSLPQKVHFYIHLDILKCSIESQSYYAGLVSVSFYEFHNYHIDLSVWY